MSLRLQNILLFPIFTMLLFVLVGCQVPQQKETATAIVTETDQQILQDLQARYEKAVPLKANGQCLLLYYTEGKARKENFPVQLWVNPPSELYMQGDVAFDAKGIVLGSNQDQFWLALSPKEISSYWWGQWSQQSSLGTMLINPRILLEGMGIIKIDDLQQWSFGEEDNYKVLKRQDAGRTKRIYIDKRDGRVKRIEYVGAEGETVTVTELDRYLKVSEGFYAPSEIKIIRRLAKDKQGFVSVTLKISTIRPASFTQEQRQFLFQRKPMQGFQHVYRITDGKVIEIQQ